MKRLVYLCAFLWCDLALGAPTFPGVTTAIQAALDAHDMAGAVTVVVTKDKVLHLEAIGFADPAAKKPMQPDTLFWIASMTKPVTAVAILLLQDEGKLDVAAPVANYLPEFAALKTPSGQPATITLSQLLTHTSGLGEASDAAALNARTLGQGRCVYGEGHGRALDISAHRGKFFRFPTHSLVADGRVRQSRRRRPRGRADRRFQREKQMGLQGAAGDFPRPQSLGLSTNKNIPIDPAGKALAKKIAGQHDWIHVEILAQGNRVRVAYNGQEVLDWREPASSLLKDGPLGLQLHGFTPSQVVIYKDILIESFPKDDRLITVKP